MNSVYKIRIQNHVSMLQKKNGCFTADLKIDVYTGCEESKITSRNRGTQIFDMTLEELTAYHEEKYAKSDRHLKLEDEDNDDDN